MAPSTPGGKPQQQANMINNARRFSIYIKNVPQDKFTNVEIDNFFSEFGEVVRVDRHLEKQAATVKFKDIESAEKAAFFANQQRRPIWGNPSVQLIYNFTGQAPRGVPGTMQAPTPRSGKFNPGVPQSPSDSAKSPAVPQLTEAQRLQKQKLDDVNKQIEKKRQLLLKKFSDDIQKGLKQLMQPDLTPE